LDVRSAGSVLRGDSRCGVETDIGGSLSLGEGGPLRVDAHKPAKS
jgi:hypothetical protein